MKCGRRFRISDVEFDQQDVYRSLASRNDLIKTPIA